MMAPAQPWPGFKYVQVPGLANRKIARWLRTQRKNMTRFFYDRGLLDLALRMEQIKASRQGMMAKNRMFQKVLDDYARLTNPSPVAVSGATEAPAAVEAAPVLSERSVVLPESGGDPAAASGDRSDAGSGVPTVVESDDSDAVIEE